MYDGRDRRRRGMKSAIMAAVVAASVGGFVQLGHAQEIKKLPSHPAAAADRSLQERSVALPSEVTSPGEAGSDVAKPNTGDPVASGETSTAQSKQHN
jgi:hypothetical protein